jgi:hypothetical protein
LFRVINLLCNSKKPIWSEIAAGVHGNNTVLNFASMVMFIM